MEILGDVGHVESQFVKFGDGVLCRCKIGARFAPNVPQAQKLFWTHTMELQGGVGHVGSCFGLLGDNFSVGAR